MSFTKRVATFEKCAGKVVAHLLSRTQINSRENKQLCSIKELATTLIQYHSCPTA